MSSGKKYKFLSVHQPLAWAICVGEKTVENKPRKTSHRGLLLIHASKSTDGLGRLKKLKSWGAFKDYLPLGAIVGAAELYDVVEFDRSLEDNPHANGPICYLLRNPKWFEEPIPCTGQLGIVNLPEELIPQVEAQLAQPGRGTIIPPEVLAEIRPSRSNICCYQGQNYLHNELFEDALRRFDEAIGRDNTNSQAFYWRSVAHGCLGQQDKMIEDISEAIRLDGENPDFLYQRAMYYREQNQLPESNRDVTSLIGLEPDQDRGYMVRGANHLFIKDYQSAIKDLERAVSINQGNVESVLLRGVALVESGKIAEGIEALSEAEEQFSDDAWPSYFLYWAYRKSNQGELAKAAMERFKTGGGEESELKDYLAAQGITEL